KRSGSLPRSRHTYKHGTIAGCFSTPTRRFAGKPADRPGVLHERRLSCCPLRLLLHFVPASVLMLFPLLSLGEKTMVLSMAVPLVLHILAAVIWVGGMFFAYMALRPAMGATLDPESRPRLWLHTLDRFFRWVWG